MFSFLDSLGPLVSKVKEYQVETIVDTLCNNMVGDKEQLRDISSIGLKTVINELPLTTQSLAASVCKTMTGRLSAAIAQQEDVSVQLEALDILGDLLSRFRDTSVHCSCFSTRWTNSSQQQPLSGQTPRWTVSTSAVKFQKTQCIY